jgi:hypothetical protein
VSTPTSAPTAGALQLTTAQQGVLAAAHAAIWAYPVIGVHLDDAGSTTARARLEQHRAERDALMSQLAARGVTPAVSRPSYTPAEPVTDAISARRWALQLETDCAAAYRYLLTLSATAPDQPAGLRRTCLSGLTDAAQSGLGWRSALTPATPTVAFPGS